MMHYAQVTEADLSGAAELAVIEDGKKTVQNPVHVVQNQVQTVATNSRTNSHETKSERGEIPCSCDEKTEKMKACDSMRDTGFLQPVGGIGLEPTASCMSSRRSITLPIGSLLIKTPFSHGNHCKPKQLCRP